MNVVRLNDKVLLASPTKPEILKIVKDLHESGKISDKVFNKVIEGEMKVRE